MAAIFPTKFSNLLFNKSDLFLHSTDFFPKDPIGHKPAVTRVMAWVRAGDKPLF